MKCKLTASQIELAGATSLWDIGDALDYIQVNLNQVSNMLEIFDEQIEGDLGYLKKTNDVYAEMFVLRYDMLRSLLEVMKVNLHGAIEELRQQINAVYEADRKALPRPLATE